MKWVSTIAVGGGGSSAIGYLHWLGLSHPAYEGLQPMLLTASSRPLDAMPPNESQDGVRRGDRQAGHPAENRVALVQSRWFTMLMTLPSGARTKNRRTPHGSVVIGFTIS
jgi:hypothetical protein